MKIRNKILLVLITVLLSCGVITISIWYNTSRKVTNTYLDDISESTMRDAYHAFEYLLTDTSYMATLISTNENNIVAPVYKLNNSKIKENNQWNQEYLNNKRIIADFIGGMNGYKYYIVGITVVANEECIFSATHLLPDDKEIYDKVAKLDQEKLKWSMVMLEPFHVEGGKSTLSSDYVVPAVRGILDSNRNIIGYTILYFDYGVIEQMFSANLPEGSEFQVVNENQALIFSNCGDILLDSEKPKDGFVYNTFSADNVGWKFTMAIPSDFYIAGIQHTVIFTVGVVAAIMILAIFVAIFIISRMTTEITVLSDSMKQVSSGNLSCSYPVKSRDEIGEMGHTFNYMVVHIKELMDKVAEEEKQKRLNEIAFLQAQINPHFISNVLNNVVWMAKIQHADNLVPLVNSLNSLLQNVMHQERDFIQLKDELAYVDNYLTIIEYSGSYDFRVEQNIEPDTENLYITRFILQPIIENVVHHGLPEDLSKQGCIKISSRRKEDELEIIVEDNGLGMSAEQIEQIMSENSKDRKSFNGIGIVNVNERIRLFFGEEYGLHYESKQGEYTRVIFRLPVIEEEEKWQK